MIKKLLSILLIFSLIPVAWGVGVQQVKAETSGKKQLEDVRDQKKQSETEMEKIEDLKVETQKELGKIETDITNLDKQIAELNKKIAANQKHVDKHEKVLSEHLRRMYVHDSGTYLSHMLNSDSFSQFLERFEIVRLLMKEQADVFNKYLDMKHSLEKNKKDLEAKKKAQAELLKKSEAKVKEINAKLAKYKDQLDQLEAKERNLLQKYAGAFGGGGGILAFPSTRGTVYWNYGQNRGSHIHAGIDIPRPVGTPIFAAESGVVQSIRSDPNGYGIYVIIRHNNGLSTLYAHMYRYQVIVGAGQRVSRGQQIASVGNNGRSSGPHLHFEVHKNGSPVNPRSYLQ
ncbi:murein hydrolase activator EnvC family protein [Thermoactinomyces mirandus]|uniref:Peptidoglycan DD-metalloendopeptidase family protein n=1 Tax=Thermoactinomyces mirandus TaxID=2756294 RepID=A0A7W1XV68_9BACL|nr:M23 family metallopeptidase [Thermoactinomyces mirandus]MBA4603580.1 peptidoglycan DD-metalloendopeptidase family protein [Thermoactinomyces mirandus]